MTAETAGRGLVVRGGASHSAGACSWDAHSRGLSRAQTRLQDPTARRAEAVSGRGGHGIRLHLCTKYFYAVSPEAWTRPGTG